MLHNLCNKLQHGFIFAEHCFTASTAIAELSNLRLLVLISGGALLIVASLYEVVRFIGRGN